MKVTYIREMDALDTMNGNEDIEWCSCWQADDYSENYMVLTEGKVNGVRIDGKDMDDKDFSALEKLAATVNPDYDPEIDAEEQAVSRMHRCGCLSCPWSDVCDAMHDESLGSIYKITDDDDEYFVLETDDDRREGRELNELRRIDDSDVASPLIPDDSDEPTYESLTFMERHFQNDFAKIPRVDMFSVDMRDGEGEQTIYWDKRDELIHSDRRGDPVLPDAQKTLYEAKDAAYEHYLHCAPAGSVRWILK